MYRVPPMRPQSIIDTPRPQESEQERMIRLADECLAMTRAINLALRERLLDRLAIECQAERQERE